MKISLIYILVAACLTSCGLHAPAEWSETSNPLDVPAGAKLVRPPSMGIFGAHSEFYN